MGIFEELKAKYKVQGTCGDYQTCGKCYHTKNCISTQVLNEAEVKLKAQLESKIEQCTDVNYEEDNYDAGKRNAYCEILEIL